MRCCGAAPTSIGGAFVGPCPAPEGAVEEMPGVGAAAVFLAPDVLPAGFARATVLMPSTAIAPVLKSRRRDNRGRVSTA